VARGRFNSRRNCHRKNVRSPRRAFMIRCRDPDENTVRAIYACTLRSDIFRAEWELLPRSFDLLIRYSRDNLQVGRPRRGSISQHCPEQCKFGLPRGYTACMKSDPTYGQRWPAHARFAPKIPRLCHGSILQSVFARGAKNVRRARARARAILIRRSFIRARARLKSAISDSRAARRGISTAAIFSDFTRDTTSA